MKKLVLLLSVFALVFISCSSDDDSSSQDPLIGTWKYHNYIVNGVEDTPTDCEMQETFVFSSDGTFDYTYYEEDFEDNCVLEESISGTWTNDGNEIYTQNIEGESYSQELGFEGNTFYYEDVYTFEGVTYTEREVYIKQ